jgi:hypothetical protein
MSFDFSVIPAPLEWPTYQNEELGYQIQYIPDWTVDEHGLTQPSREVIFYPANPEDFKVALSVSLDQRTLDVIQQVYADNSPQALPSQVELAGEQATLYMYPWGRIEVYVPHREKVFLIITDYADQTEYLQSIGSFEFLD